MKGSYYTGDAIDIYIYIIPLLLFRQVEGGREV